VNAVSVKHAVRCAIAAGALAGLAATPAIGAPWEFNPRLEAGYLYDDNYRLASPGAETSVNGPLADVAVELRTITQTGEFSLTPRVRATYFPDESQLDAVDYFALLNWERRGQRVNSLVRADFSEQDTVRSEQPSVDSGGGLGQPDIGDAGRVLVENRRRRIELRPSFTFDISERRELQFEAGHADVSFDEQVDGAQVDYTVSDVALGLLTRLSERNSLTARLRGTRYEIDVFEPTNGYGAELQWDRQTTTETRSYFRIGGQQVEIDTVDPATNVLIRDEKVAIVGGAGMNWLLGRNELFLDLSRNVGASSAGSIVTRDQLRLRWVRAITPRLSLLAGLRGTRDEDLDEGAASTFTERSYATGDVGLQWRWQEEFSLRVAYDYTWQEFRTAAEDATSSGAIVSVLYQPLQRRRQRND
jgi:hypothetical protein